MEGIHAMLFALLSAIGVTALLFVWLFQFCHWIVGVLVPETP
jgi:hypothetical protein